MYRFEDFPEEKQLLMAKEELSHFLFEREILTQTKLENYAEATGIPRQVVHQVIDLLFQEQRIEIYLKANKETP